MHSFNAPDVASTGENPIELCMLPANRKQYSDESEVLLKLLRSARDNHGRSILRRLSAVVTLVAFTTTTALF